MGCTFSFNNWSPKDPPDDAYTKRNGSIVAEVRDMSDEHFSQHQKSVLRDTWRHLSADQHEHGVAIFMQIFATRAETKQLFPFRDLEGEELLKNSLFRSHSKRFMHAIETTINHLDALDLILVPVLHRLGERHVRISGFRIEYLSVFIGSMLDVFAEALGRKFTREVRAAWLHLGQFIANRMNEGYQLGLGAMPANLQTGHEESQIRPQNSQTGYPHSATENSHSQTEPSKSQKESLSSQIEPQNSEINHPNWQTENKNLDATHIITVYAHVDKVEISLQG